MLPTDDIITADQLAPMLLITVGTLHDRISARPWSVPPRIVLGKRNKPIWLRETVHSWLKSKEVTVEAP